MKYRGSRTRGTSKMTILMVFEGREGKSLMLDKSSIQDSIFWITTLSKASSSQ